MPVPAIATWLAGTVASDAYNRAVDAARQPSEARRLRDQVRGDTGHRFSVRRFDNWYKRDETWRDLVAHTPAAYDSLRASLHEALWNRRRFPTHRVAPEKQAEVTDELVATTIGHFVQCLPVSTAVAVADHRSGQEHAHIAELIRGQDNLDERLKCLPFSIREALEQMRGTDNPLLTRLLEFFEQTAGTPAERLSALLNPPVGWVQTLPATGLVALAEFAAAHRVPHRASLLYEQASETGVNRARHLALGAIFAAQAGDYDRARRSIAQALALDNGDVLVTTIDAAMREDTGGILGSLDAAKAGADPVVTALVARALVASDRTDEAIELLRHSTSASPELIGQHLFLAQLLIDRIILHRSPNRTGDLREVRERSLTARDARRLWAGPSSEAVAVACQGAALGHDDERVLCLGLPWPAGEATVEEAEAPEVLSFVARALLGIGDLTGAEQAAARTGDVYVQELIAAKVCLFSDPPITDEGAQHVWAAWALAEDEGRRLDVQITASALGMWPLPGHEDLEGRDDDLAALLLAQSEHARGDSASAIARLRQHEGLSEPCAMLLSQIYAEQGSTDHAVEELQHAADRFQRPEFLVNAAGYLLRAERHDEATRIAVTALAELDVDAPARRGARQILIEIAQGKQDWVEMEKQARVGLTEMDPSTDCRWILVFSLFNQGRREEAWRACIAEGDLEPENAKQAGLWAQLHCAYAPGPDTTLHVAELLERYIDDEQGSAVIVNALLLMDASQPVSDEVSRRWNAALTLFLERYPNNQNLQTIRVSEGFDEFIAFMRDTVGASAPAIEDMARRVSDGQIPYGMLSAIANRPYGAALLHRAGAGCLLVYPADRSQATQDRADAAAALGGSAVVDTSVLGVASFTEGLWPLIQTSLGALTITDPTFQDVVASRDTCNRGDGTTFGWDTEAGKPTIDQIPAEVLTELRRRAAFMEERATELRHEPWPTQCSLGSPGDPDTRLDDNQRFWSWASGVDYAKTKGMPFFCDDVALRMLARSEGVPTFGSAALLEVLEEQGTVATTTRVEMFSQWRSQFCVDLPGTEELLEFARRAGFDPGPAALTLTRPAFWQDRAAVPCYMAICKEAARIAPEQLPKWLYAAIRGAMFGQLPEHSARIAADLLLRTEEVSAPSTPTVFAKMIAAAREALGPTGAELLLADVFRPLLARLAPLGAEIGPQYVLALSSELAPEDRLIARGIAFGPPGQSSSI